MAFNDYLAKELTKTERILLDVVQLAYRKHYLHEYWISGDRLENELQKALSETMGIDFATWLRKTKCNIKVNYPRTERGA